MKKILKIFGLLTLMCFSFFYTDKVINVLSDKDPLKMKISELSGNYNINPVEAIINEDEIIPGINGRTVDIEKSYKSMQKSNVFNEKLLEYKELYPQYRLYSNLDKYIVKANNIKNNVSILFIIDSNNNLNKIVNVLDNNNVIANFFVEYKYLNNNISTLRNYNNHNLYSYQDNYTYDNLIISNNIIKRISNNDPIFCLTKEKNKSNINVCSYSNMFTVIPSLSGEYNVVKNNLENGSIILFNTTNVNELDYLIKFILSKGYNIVSLSDLLSENI